jgi:8-oxo-dGTP pyrophosphatase MutT (NUDIX family)
VGDVSKIYSDGIGETPTEAILAATLIVVRDGEDGLEVLMLRRPPGGNFGGFWVFPGGKVDPADHADGDDEFAPFRRAAAREATEECDIAIDPNDVVTLSYWEPPPRAGVRFGTWFFVAPHPGGDVTIDGSEIVAYDWVRPRDAQARRDGGDFDLAPPTWVTLETLASFAMAANAIVALANPAFDAPIYHTRIVKADGHMLGLWHGDAGYDTHDAAVPGARHRLIMGKTFVFEQHD